MSYLGTVRQQITEYDKNVEAARQLNDGGKTMRHIQRTISPDYWEKIARKLLVAVLAAEAANIGEIMQLLKLQSEYMARQGLAISVRIETAYENALPLLDALRALEDSE